MKKSILIWGLVAASTLFIGCGGKAEVNEKITPDSKLNTKLFSTLSSDGSNFIGVRSSDGSEVSAKCSPVLTNEMSFSHAIIKYSNNEWFVTKKLKVIFEKEDIFYFVENCLSVLNQKAQSMDKAK